MTVFERIQILAKKQGKSVKEVSRELDFGESTIYKWKTQSPKAEYLEKIADYFNVSLDYLQGRTENPNMLDSDDQSMAKQVMMRMDTDGLSRNEIDEIEKEMERFFAWRIEEIKKERDEK